MSDLFMQHSSVTKSKSRAPTGNSDSPASRTASDRVVDDKIELNCRMNATLESLARAILKSWVVDFDPVKINAGQMPASSAISTTHDPKVLELFPSTFQDSEVSLDLLYGDELIRTRIDLNPDQYAIADAAHMSGSPVIIRGELHRGRRAHRITNITRFQSAESLAEPQE